jgi:hypothetical protein
VTPLELLRLLLDHDRLSVAGALAARPMTTDEVVAATGRDRRVVLTAIGDLRAARLVTSTTTGTASTARRCARPPCSPPITTCRWTRPSASA